MNSKSDEQRFVALEEKVAYQEKLLADLNDVLLQHTRKIDQLESLLEQFQRMLREGPGENPGHEAPPHY